MSLPDPEEVLAFWFVSLDANGFASEETAKRWFTKDPTFDEEIRARFGALHAELAAGRDHGWLAAPRSTLAYVIVLDQFSRNMHRGTPGMFASDPLALAAARAAADRGDDRKLATQERTFLYMPFMHSESLADQERCLELFRALADEQPPETKARIEQNHHFGVRHRDIVERFGRFPHRNEVLGRASTPEEVAFLTEPSSSF